MVIIAVYNNTDDTTEHLREKCTKLETTRQFVCWHDHSDIAGSTYYIVTVWFIYDPAIYLTDKEVHNR